MNSEKMSRKILVVDDDLGHVRLLETMLKENGFNPISTVEAADGLQMAMEKQPDLIILDVMMPVINGYNFCRLLKSETAYKNIPIIFLSSRGEKQDLRFGQEMGADAYLTKPVNTQQLLVKINELLSSAK
ncbi:MAG: Response regulator receiver protein [Candidatus Kaiserbacteria bacterium GW2011_GWA2_49_19]|uniref:Response regulator receiver protein n=1 Tax=Candidatus Kaiserbacteria bacterium GW2011_GWA2_49_19 TaxID=1618669 RepID=A0A0G1Y1Y6_9BACT|nr:MAG: Response regulator receiver protein [Candidatus Kaiserbacteria bacterium GW2011_GWA2_49_19]